MLRFARNDKAITGIIMQVTVNGENKVMLDNIDLENALIKWGYGLETFAVAINKQFVPRSKYAMTLLNANDHIEIVTPMQGG